MHSPRNALTIAHELRDLLAGASETGPYVLVGHSFGGHIVRVFAGRYPTLTAGMVLVDASHEDMFRNLRTRPFTMVVSARTASASRAVLPGSLPARFRETALQFAARAPTRVAIKSETYYFIRSGEEARSSRPPTNIPVTVVSRGVPQTGRNPAEKQMAQRWDELQLDLHNRMGTSGQVTATRSGHYPHLDEPELVSHAILGVVRPDQGQPLVSR